LNYYSLIANKLLGPIGVVLVQKEHDTKSSVVTNTK